MRRLRLQHRILIPFVLQAAVVTTLAAYAAWSVTAAALQSRMQAQLSGAAATISRGGFALNPAILQNVRDIVGADIVTFDADGRVLATTIPASRPLMLTAARQALRGAGTNAMAAVRADCGTPCLVALHPIEGQPDAAVALVAETSELATATRALGRAIVLGAIASVLVMVFVAQAVVSRVTAPLERLVAFVRGLSPGDTRQRAAVGRDEIGDLAEAFNGLLDRVQRFQQASVRSEKLALAGMLAARVAHDIRNPLSSIRMQTQLLQSKLRGDAEDTEVLNAVLHDIGEVESVIRDLLELARPGEYNLQPTAVNTVIAETLAERAPQFRHRRISVETHLADPLPVVLMDQSRFRQALLNILMNASEAMATGGQIVVTSRLDDGAIAIDVCDDGTGVDPAVADRVFDPFVSTKRDGVGLGLVNVKAVVDGHGGVISLAARRPRGTCVSIKLPVLQTHG